MIKCRAKFIKQGLDAFWRLHLHFPSTQALPAVWVLGAKSFLTTPKGEKSYIG